MTDSNAFSSSFFTKGKRFWEMRQPKSNVIFSINTTALWNNYIKFYKTKCWELSKETIIYSVYDKFELRMEYSRLKSYSYFDGSYNLVKGRLVCPTPHINCNWGLIEKGTSCRGWLSMCLEVSCDLVNGMSLSSDTWNKTKQFTSTKQSTKLCIERHFNCIELNSCPPSYHGYWERYHDRTWETCGVYVKSNKTPMITSGIDPSLFSSNL